jgi:4-hydroxy-tetrahydrodipicolinate synthase
VTPDPASFRLRGVFSVLPTAFHEGGALDLEGTGALARASLDAGATGLTVLGVMGEAAELSEDERAAVLAAVLEAAAGRPIILGVTAEREELVGNRAQAAAAAGASALMVSPTPTVDLEAAVSAAALGGLPIVIQDYPPASGVTITVEELAAPLHALVIGVKAEAPPTSSAIAALAHLRPDLDVMGGLGGLFLMDELRAGATGTMTGFAMPERLASIVATFPSDPAAAALEWASLLPLMRLEAFQPFSLAARKEVWRLRGVIGSAHCRRKGAVLDETSRADIRRALESVGVPVPA